MESRIHKTYEAVTKAHEVGTYGAIDRSKQYQGVSQSEMLEQVNLAWSKIRALEKSATDKDLAILNLETKLRRERLVNIALTSIITGLAWEGLKVLIEFLSR